MDGKELQKIILDKMGYVEESRSCKICHFYEEDEDFDDEEEIDELGECELNPALFLDIKPDGCCKFFKEITIETTTEKPPKPKKGRKRFSERSVVRPGE